MPVVIRCKYDMLSLVVDLKPHPKNRNVHPADQIDRLAQMITYQGVRAPIVVSNLSGYMVKGHGTLLAEIKCGMTEVPVVYQDFESAEQEYAFLQGDNAIADWAELDMAGINQDLADLGPDFDVDHLGLRDFVVEPMDAAFPELPTGGRSDLEQITFTLSAAQGERVRQAVAREIERGLQEDAVNKNKNGNALAQILERSLVE